MPGHVPIFSLPAPVAESGVKARYENGIVTLNRPKEIAGGAKKIPIS